MTTQGGGDGAEGSTGLVPNQLAMLVPSFAGPKAKEAEKAIGGKIITSRRDQPGIMVKGNHPKKKPSFRLVNYYCKLLLFYYYYFTTIIILLYLDLRTTHIVLMCWLVVSFPLYQPYPIEIFQFRITLILLSPGVAEKNPNSRPFLGWSD